MKKTSFLLKLISPFFIFTLFLAILLGNAYRISAKLPFSGIKTKNYTVAANSYGLVVSSAKTDETLFSVSPLDDWFYTKTGKYHVFDKIVSGGNSLQNLKNTLANTISRHTYFRWDESGVNAEGKASIVYKLIGQGEQLQIQRNFSSQSSQAFGLSVHICDTCFVFDKRKRVYFNPGSVTDEKSAVMQHIAVLPIVVRKDQILPVTDEITVGNQFGDPLFTVYFTGDYVYYDEKYHLLEFKEINTGNTFHLQEIKVW